MARKLLQHFPSLSIHQSDRRVQCRHCHRFAVFQQVDRRDGVFKIIFHQLSHPDIVRANIAVNGSSNELVPRYDNASDRVFCILEDLDGMALLRFDVPNAHGGVEALISKLPSKLNAHALITPVCPLNRLKIAPVDTSQ